MDPLGAFKSEVFRPIASIVLPGMLSISTFAIVLGNSIAEVRELYDEQALVFFILLFGASTIAGMLLENIGSSIERGIDTCMDNEYLPGAGAVWSAYLACACSDSYARKYLGTLVTRMKFINSMMPATVLFMVGLLALNLQVGRWSWTHLFLVAAVLLLTVSWLFKSSVELSEAALFSRFKMLPKDHGLSLNTGAHTVNRRRHFAYAAVELRTARIEEMNFKGTDGISLLWAVMRLFVGLSLTARAKAPLNESSPHAVGETASGKTVSETIPLCDVTTAASAGHTTS